MMHNLTSVIYNIPLFQRYL